MKRESLLRTIAFIFLSSLVIFLMNGCSVNKYLEENQYLLYKQTIKGNKKVGKDALTPLFKQKPNRHILGTMPYLYAYYIGKQHLDTAKVNRDKQKIIDKYQKKISKIDTSSTNKKRENRIAKVNRLREKRDKKIDKQNLKLKEGNWLMRVVGEPPSLYDSASTNYNIRQIHFYLHSKGYFQGTATAKVDTNGKRVFEEYNITEKTPYVITSFEYEIGDTSIRRILSINENDILVKTGKNYDEVTLSGERDRINKVLKENGYYDFNTQYIFIEVDSTLGDQKIAVRVVIRNPANESMHPRYKINKIVFNTNTRRNTEGQLDSTVFNGILFVYSNDNFSKKILSKKVRFNVGEYYAQSKIQLTQRQLAALDMYKFININFDKNKSDTLANGLTVHIRTNPLKIFQTTEEAGMNISSSGNKPGPFGSLNFKSRNTFRGFEVFERNLRASVLWQASVLNPSQNNSREEYSANISLSFPQFFLPGGLKYRLEDYSPRTKFVAGYTVDKRPEYTRGILTASMNYILIKGLYSTYTLGLIDLNLINTLHQSPEFFKYLKYLTDQGNNLGYSFKRTIVSDINASYTYNNNVLGTNKKSHYVKLYGESGGTTKNLFPNLALSGFQTYKYYKINTDFRFYMPTGKYNSFVTRFNFGYAHSYDTKGVLPIERYFFMGGSNSMRAWEPLRLGPGSFIQPDSTGSTQFNYSFQQPGEIMFEMNYEYRFHIISFLEGAAFIDAGNLWALRKDKERRGAEFKFNSFYKQIAIGAGLGIRLNFSFLILRLDFAKKVYDPAIPRNSDGIPLETERPKFVLFQKSVLKDTQMNIGIGYPF